jgi:hypothetical protein
MASVPEHYGSFRARPIRAVARNRKEFQRRVEDDDFDDPLVAELGAFEDQT